MRIKSLSLSWFRGAGPSVGLDPDSKSIVVYGSNGAGKSSFVDAIEYLLKNGKIGHLAHEYSGTKLERAVPNTHKPKGAKVGLSLVFKDKQDLTIEIKDGGSSTRAGSGIGHIAGWDYRRTVLRQDEVAEFIRGTKGEKYSALLPLLGLTPLEYAAENLRQLSRAIEVEAQVRESRVAIAQVENTQRLTFGDSKPEYILAALDGLFKSYCPEKPMTAPWLEKCTDIATAVDARIAASTSDQRRYVVLQSMAQAPIAKLIGAVRAASVGLADSVDPLISEKLEVLARTSRYVEKLTVEVVVPCPACGRVIAKDQFKDHLQAENERLKAIIEAFDTRNAAISSLIDALKNLKESTRKPDVRTWKQGLVGGELGKAFQQLEELNPEGLRSRCDAATLNELEGGLKPIIDAAADSSKEAPPDAAALTKAKSVAMAVKVMVEGKAIRIDLARAESLILAVNNIEHRVRAQIAERATMAIEEITSDIQSMWSILHPNERVEQVSLYVPADVEKAIDIRLKFHGVEQASPRLTLSEGYRNSLGLCIFLAAAKRDQGADAPIILDDVVVSLDRNHRGMLAQLLETMFSDRQVILLTHDRDWYAELRHQLDEKKWSFRSLLPYANPEVGIRWSHTTSSFNDARARVGDRPDTAGNDARKIMDTELAMIAERLELRLPFRRGDRNDKRTGHEILERLIAEGKKSLRKKAPTGHAVHADAIAALEDADTLLVTWGNRASHSFDVAPEEANKLIDACERALAALSCETCKRQVFFSPTTSGWKQCACGDIRWAS